MAAQTNAHVAPVSSLIARQSASMSSARSLDGQSSSMEVYLVRWAPKKKVRPEESETVNRCGILHPERPCRFAGSPARLSFAVSTEWLHF